MPTNRKDPIAKIDETPREPPEADAGKARDPGGERPEALAQFAEAAREDKGKPAPREQAADAHSQPIDTSNPDKHDVATRLLEEGALGDEPDPKEAGVDKLPDRIVDSR